MGPSWLACAFAVAAWALRRTKNGTVGVSANQVSRSRRLMELMGSSTLALTPVDIAETSSRAG